MKLFLSAILAIILIVAGWFFFIMYKISAMGDPVYNQIELTSPDGQKLHQVRNWGITGDAQLTIIETKAGREFDIDSTRQILFEGLDPFLYKVKGDTLVLLVRQKSIIPKSFESVWTIIQQEVDTSTMMRLSNGNEYEGI